MSLSIPGGRYRRGFDTREAPTASAQTLLGRNNAHIDISYLNQLKCHIPAQARETTKKPHHQTPATTCRNPYGRGTVLRAWCMRDVPVPQCRILRFRHGDRTVIQDASTTDGLIYLHETIIVMYNQLLSITQKSAASKGIIQNKFQRLTYFSPSPETL